MSGNDQFLQCITCGCPYRVGSVHACMMPSFDDWESSNKSDSSILAARMSVLERRVSELERVVAHYADAKIWLRRSEK